MPQRRVLFLETSQLTAYRIGGGSVQAEGGFAADTAGLEAFSAYLTQHHRSVFMLLADVAEEGFQLDEVPPSSGKDRQAILKRKLAQYFYGTPLALALSQGRLKTGRRDERLLLMALTRPQHFEPWLNVLRETRSILAGIYSLPQTMQNLLPAEVPPQLLLITQTHGGLRQTYFADRQLRFSRLTTLATGSAEESAIATALEASKMHQYLASQRLIERGKPLATRVLAHPAQVSAIRERCRDTAELRFEFADLLQEAKRVGLNSALADSHAEMLFCHLLEKKPPAEQFAPPAERQFHRLWQTRFALKGAAAVILVAGLLFTAKQGLEMLHTQDAIAQIQQQTRLDQQRYDATMQALPKIPLSIDNLRTLVNRGDQVLKRAQGPGPLLIQLSRSLDAFPGISIERLEWKITEQIEPVPTAAAAGAASTMAPPPIPANMAGGPYAQVTVAAQLPLSMEGNQRGQLALVADFAKHLGTAPNTLVTILQQPVDTQSSKTLKSGDEKRTLEAPKFSFRLTHKL
jgi:hypothetical protein